MIEEKLKPAARLFNHQNSYYQNNIHYLEDEFWTAKQKQSSSLHEIPYRACFKAEIPHFFINRLTKPNEIIYDPFAGRGTTGIEAGILRRKVILNDSNPLSTILSRPRFFIPELAQVKKKLTTIFSTKKNPASKTNLAMFFHPDTEKAIIILKNFLANNHNKLDQWIRMVATTRLTGHSKGYFSVYTLPPNQAISIKKQIQINQARNQKPPYRDVAEIILDKTKKLIRNVTLTEKNNLKEMGGKSLFLNEQAHHTPQIKNNSIDLIVTSPPFLDVINYSKDNWLRCWFNAIDLNTIEKKISVYKKIGDWENFILLSLKEFFRILKKKKYLIFEVGEIRNGKIKLDELVIPLAKQAGFFVEGVMINTQNFTKTSNVWGVKNNTKGTNTNRLLVLKKDG